METRQLVAPMGGTCPCPVSDCGEAESALGCGPEPLVGLLHPNAPDFLDRLAEVNGFDLSLTQARPQTALTLPDYLVQVDPWAAKGVALPSTVAITLSRWMRRGGIKSRSALSLRERLGLPASTNVVVLLIAPDHLLERAWAERVDLIETLSRWEPSAVVGPGLSMWSGRSALEHLYAQTRIVRFLELLQDAGLPVIPDVNWVRSHEAERWATWLTSNPINNIAVDLQAIGIGLQAYLRELASFRGALVSPPSLLVNGIASARDIASMCRVWPEATFTSDVIPLVENGHFTRPARDGSPKRVKASAPEDPPGFWPTDPRTTSQLFAREIETRREAVTRGRALAYGSAIEEAA